MEQESEFEYNILRKSLDDLAVTANAEADLQQRLLEWKGIFGRHGLRVGLERTEVLYMGQHNKDLDIRLGGKKRNKGENFV